MFLSSLLNKGQSLQTSLWLDDRFIEAVPIIMTATLDLFPTLITT